jgi:hypothetical protein
MHIQLYKTVLLTAIINAKQKFLLLSSYMFYVCI